jgi:monovalent cation/hydrogen antiporter
MTEHFSFYLIVVFVIVMLIILADKIKVAYPILLVISGLLISFIPGVPTLNINPELIFIIFLPPLLYEAAWAISWKALYKWRRIVLSFAFLVVFVTALSVAMVAYNFIPGFTLALGFLLGGIVSPPDAVSAGAILRFVKVPTRLSSILEGESLLNDASSLIIFQFALVAVSTGKFQMQDAVLSFLWMVVGGVGTGLLVGWIFMQIHKRLPTNAPIDIALSIITPYAMYILAEEVHGSGVLAVVAGGLFLAYNRFEFLNNQSRMRAHGFWESLCFILNGLVFMLIGLDLPQIVSGLGDTSLTDAVGYGILITLVLMGVRILSGYGAVITTLVMRNFITVADSSHPGWKAPLVIGWTGMRGVVSLAAALSIPPLLADGTAFPQRNLILFITFVVILLTLIIQGLTLPYLIRRVKFSKDHERPEEEVDAFVLREFSNIAHQYLEQSLRQAKIDETLFAQLTDYNRDKLSTDEKFAISDSVRVHSTKILELQRRWLIGTNRSIADLDEEIVHKHLNYLDHEEERLDLR